MLNQIKASMKKIILFLFGALLILSAFTNAPPLKDDGVQNKVITIDHIAPVQAVTVVQAIDLQVSYHFINEPFRLATVENLELRAEPIREFIVFNDSYNTRYIDAIRGPDKEALFWQDASYNKFIANSPEVLRIFYTGTNQAKSSTYNSRRC